MSDNEWFWAPWVRRVMMALAFFALPLAFIGVELQALRQALAEETRAREQGELLSSLRTLRTRQDFRQTCREWFLKQLNEVTSADSPRRALAEMQRCAPLEFGIPVEFLVLKRDGSTDEKLSTMRLPESIAPFVYQDFVDLENPKKGITDGMNSRLPAYQECFGTWIYQLGFLANLEGIHQVRLHERRQNLFISRVYRFGRLLAVFDHPVDWETREIGRALAARRQKMPHERGAVLSPNLQKTELEAALGSGFESAWAALRLMGTTTRQAVRVGDWLWAQVPIDQSSRVILGRPDSTETDLARFRHRLLWILAGVFAGATVLFWRWSLLPDGIPFRLSTRLFLLLTYVVGLPLLVYGLTAQSLSRDLHEVRQRQWHARHVAILAELDRRYLDFIGRLETTLEKRFALSASSEPIETRLQKLLEGVIKELEPILAVYVDPAGVARFESGVTSFELSPPLQKLVFKACAGVLGAPAPVKKQPGDELSGALSEEFGINTELLTSIFTELPGHLLDLEFLNHDKALLLNPVAIVSSGTAVTPYAVLTGWEPHRLRGWYLERFLPQFQKRKPEIPLAGRVVVGDPVIAPTPSDSPLLRAGEEVVQGFREARRPVTLSVALGSETWLLTGYRGAFLKGFLTMAGSSSLCRDVDAAVFNHRIGLIGVLLALSGLLIARLLSSTFLGPIRELAHGVDALARRDFSHRIPPIGKDELGHLGLAFNQMLEDLKDLELARILQERIYPTAVANLGHGWEIYGDCRPASEVGGDLFDYFPLQDGRWCIVVGDVSGHGTPSALIVAMAKGLFSHPRNGADPEQILHDVQAVMVQVLPKKRMMMTCFVALFTPMTGQLQYANAGHNYPYLVDAHGNQRQLQTKSLPLGVSRKRREGKGQDVATLEPGGFLFLYTDGFIEALDRQGNAIGYDAVQSRLAALAEGGAKAGVAGLRAWHDTQVAPGPQADDITLVLLRHRQNEGDSIE